MHFNNRFLKLKAFDKAGLDRGRTRFWGGDDEETTTSTQTNTYQQAPEFPEAKGARERMSTDLQSWNASNNYGLMGPNWDDVYNNAAKKIREYFFGSPMMGGGAMGVVNASIARGNKAASPAAEILKGRMGVEMANKMGDLRSATDLQRANAGENSRLNWMRAMQNLMGQTPKMLHTGSTGTTTAPADSGWDALATGVGYGAGQFMGNTFFSPIQKAAGSWFDNLMNPGGQTGGKTPNSLTDDFSRMGANASPDWRDLTNSGLSIASAIPGPQQPFVAGASFLSNLFNG